MAKSPVKLKKKTAKSKRIVKVKPPEKVNRRSKNPFRALDPNLNLRSRWEEIADLASYANTLSPKDKEWLNKFSSEYVCAEFGDKPLHKTKRLKKAVYDKNNARNRCILTKSHAYGNTKSLDDVNLDLVKVTKRNLEVDSETDDQSYEDYSSALDNTKKLK